MASEARSIAVPAIRGSVWTIAGYAASQILRLGGNLVLTRLLFPEVFGQMALVFTFLQGLQMFSDVGTGPAIVQNARGDDEAFLNTAWTVQCARGGVLWATSWVIAWPVAHFYGQPMLRWLIPAAGATALFAGFEATSVHVLQRHLRLERLTILDLGTQLVGMVVTIGLAIANRRLYGPDSANAVWAIVVGALTSSLCRLVLTHAYLPGIRNRFKLEREALGQLFGFGRWIFVSTLLTFLAGQSDRLIFGKMIPLALLGLYSIAAMLAALPTQAVLKLGGAVVFPAYSRLATRADFGQVFSRVRAPLLMGGGVVVSALVSSGPHLVRVLYDERYGESGWILRLLAAAAWFQILECTNGAALLAKGRVGWVAAGSAAKVVGMIALIPLGFHIDGFRGALVGLIASELLKYSTSAVGARSAGLSGWRGDLLLTAATAGLVAAGALGGEVGARRAGNLVGLVASLAIVMTLSALLALWYLRHGRAAREEPPSAVEDPPPQMQR